MHMPVMDGPTTIATIRKSAEPWRDISVIALTADAMSGDRERYLGMGMNGYLSKPLAERDLLSEIARVRTAEALRKEQPREQPGAQADEQADEQADDAWTPTQRLSQAG
jgi:CheY-like chemotaxis protein